MNNTTIRIYDWKTLCFLGVIAIALNSFAPLSFLAPIPLAFSSLIFGRQKGLFLGVGCILLLLVANLYMGIFPSVAWLFIVSIFNATVISEIVFRDIDPSKGLLYGGMFIIIVVFAVMIFYIIFGNNLLENVIKNNLMIFADALKKNGQSVVAQGGDDAKLLQDFITKPDSYVQEVINWFPAAVFFSVFAGQWIGMIGVLRNPNIWMRTRRYSFSLRHIVRFRAPEYLVGIVVFSLVLILIGEYVFGKYGEIIGWNLLYCIGVFYFIQGLGIYFDFLSNAGIKGLLRTILLFFAVVFANRLFALLGLFDMWFNFRKYFNKLKK